MKEIAIAVISLVVGAIIGPYINWGIEQKKQKLAYRRELVTSWRKLCAAVLKDCEEVKGKGYYWRRIEKLHEFGSLRSQINGEIYDEIKMRGDDHDCHLRIVEQIGIIEKRWKLL